MAGQSQAAAGAALPGGDGMGLSGRLTWRTGGIRVGGASGGCIPTTESSTRKEQHMPSPQFEEAQSLAYRIAQALNR
ncbi:MAG TPA: hypothetical protein VNM48_15620, partial [Chloroflexota bacterium]|nr:hypothetical protein [Chloroflexota bacterium]